MTRSSTTQRRTGRALRPVLFGCAGLAALVLASPAFAQDDDTEITVSGDVTAVVGSVDGDLEADLDARVKVEAARYLENGLEVGGTVEARGDSDLDGTYWTGGRYSSIFGGGARGVAPDEGDVFLQSAFGYIKGGFGQISIGRDDGVASQLAVTSPTIFSSIGVNDWKTDLTGLNDVHTVNDFSGYATKLNYLPPANFLGGALGGLQVGLSYAPDLGNCDGPADCAAAGSPFFSPVTYTDVLETALYYEKALGQSRDVRLGLGASYVRADEEEETTESFPDDYAALSLGLNVAFDGFTVGGSVKNTNAGVDQEDEDGYLAFDAGVTYETGPWGFMLGYGASDTEFTTVPVVPLGPSIYRETQSAQAGVSYVFDRGVTLGAAAQFVDSEKNEELGGDEDAAAVVFESNFKF